MAGGDVVILPDNDMPGQKYARDVATLLMGLTPPAMVKTLALPELPAKGDVFDFVKARREKRLPDEAIRGEIETSVASIKPEVVVSATGERAEKKSQADQVVTLAEEHYLIGQSTSGEPFAVARNGSNLALMFSGSKSPFKSALSRLFRQAHQKVPTAAALGDAMCALAGEAHCAKSQVVALRLATHANGIIIDLGDSEGRAVQVTSTGWQVIDRSPVLFQRTALSAAMPIPVHQGDGLDRLRNLLNVSDDDWSLLVAYLVSTFFPDIAHPILLVGGQQGTGKSTASRLIVETIDPSTCPLRSEPKNLESWTLAAAGSWAVCLDNLSDIPDWLSDAI